MKRSIWLAILIASVFGVAQTTGAMQSESYRLDMVMVSSGDRICVSDSFQMDGAVTQFAPIGTSSSASYRLMPLFRHQLLQLLKDGDVNGDGIVNLQDAVLALRILSNIQSIAGQKDADVNGDGAIGVEEVIFVLQKVSSIR